ncbi:MAG TPA: hypothetical protein VMA72_17685 [Streptosporangiaceae bacterium]|nr:hypothetical protein [Streptosporangiaceae bacterium]
MSVNTDSHSLSEFQSAKQNGVTGCREREPEKEERDQENRRQQPRNLAWWPFLLLRVLVRLVTHRVPLIAGIDRNAALSVCKNGRDQPDGTRMR